MFCFDLHQSFHNANGTPRHWPQGHASFQGHRWTLVNFHHTLLKILLIYRCITALTRSHIPITSRSVVYIPFRLSIYYFPIVDASPSFHLHMVWGVHLVWFLDQPLQETSSQLGTCITSACISTPCPLVKSQHTIDTAARTYLHYSRSFGCDLTLHSALYQL